MGKCSLCPSAGLDRQQEEYEELVEEYIASVRLDYLNNFYTDFASRESFTMTYTEAEHHYTLYYYDQAGNLIKTVPPRGVVPFVDQSHLDQIASVIAGDPGKQELFPDHKMVTYYQYNTRNQVTKQYMPDHDGESYFWYDRLGQLLVSQNPRQAQAARFSYSLYDNLSRVVESGEMEPINPGIPGQFSAASPHIIMRNFSWINDWFFGATGYEVTSSVYDNQVHPTNHSSLQRVGKNLNKRIGTVAYFNERPNNSNGMDVNASGTIESLGENSNRETAFNSADYLLHYSYDIHGNVADYYQEAMDTDFESENNINGNLAGIEMRLPILIMSMIYYQEMSKELIISPMLIATLIGLFTAMNMMPIIG